MTRKEIVDKEHLHLRLIHEISDLINKSTGLDTILKSVVKKISTTLNFNVVSIYVWDEAADGLRLRANVGLKVKSSDAVFLKSEEGLTGLVHKTKRPLIEMPASRHPGYKYFPEIGEEEYESYIGVPIILNNRCVGVLVGQNRELRPINPAEETLFQIVALSLAGLLEVADTLSRLKTPSIVKHETRTYQGKGVSSGMAIGKAILFKGLFQQISTENYKTSNPEKEKEKIHNAIQAVSEELKNTIKELNSDKVLTKSEIDIFEAHLMIINSSTLEDSLVSLIEEKKMPAETAVVEYIEELASQFESLSDNYLREKVQDFRDIGERLLHQLTKTKTKKDIFQDNAEGSIIVAREIGPSFVSMLYRNKVNAVVSEKGGETSHAVIIAKSLGIPVVVGIDNIFNIVHSGDELMVDGRTGFIFTNPDESLKNEYQISFQKSQETKKFIEDQVKEWDNHNPLGINITANIGFPIDVELARHYGIKSVGLFRTEFAFTQFKKWPAVRSQVKVYKKISSDFNGPITIRTLDIGADKLLPYLNMPEEENPLLGLRAIRFSMEYLPLFRDQIKSILLAIRKGSKFRILLPMITSLWEVETAKQIVEELSREVGLGSADVPELGVMMEVPALVYQLEDYKDMIDFVSVGSNDLIQYTLAVDRNSNVIGHLYSAFHPSVVRMLDIICDKIGSIDKELSICGEIAGQPTGALLLIALGYKHLSVSPAKYPFIKYLTGKVTSSELAELKGKVLQMNKQSDIEAYTKDMLSSIDPKLLEIA